jgi:hypothetical protein
VDEPKPAPGAPKKALKYDKKSGLRFAGVPARNLTADETAGWVRDKAQYDEMISSGAYSVADEKPAAKEDK